MARFKGISANLNALLDTIAYAEGVISKLHPLTKDDGYDVIVTGVDGPEIFTDYTKHPFADGRKSKVINSKGLTSNASGRYQFMLKDYNHYKKLLNLFDFGPISQDKWAIQLIKERKALPLIEAGKFEEAVNAISNLWASLPGAGYNQREHLMSDLKNIYLVKGGKVWDSKPLSVLLSQPLPQPLEPSLSEGIKVNPKPIPTTELKKPTNVVSALFNLIKNLRKPK